MDGETEAVVKQFDFVLKELTFNSRPIITTLTKMAEENISCAKYFVEILENRIDKCVPSQKLFAFYALDSICKNAGSPYTIFFSKNLFKLYKKTYLIVNNQVRTKLISLFKSWLQPTKATGEPVFDKTTLNVIENFLVKASALHQKNLESMLPTPTIPLLFKEIDKLTALSNERIKDLKDNNNVNSEDYNKLLAKLEVLKQLRLVLAKEKLSGNALKQVQLQLKQVFAQDQQYLQEKHRIQQQQQLHQQQQGAEREQSQSFISNENYSFNTTSNIAGASHSGTSIIPLFNNNKNSDRISNLNKDLNLQNSSESSTTFSTLFGPNSLSTTASSLNYGISSGLNFTQPNSNNTNNVTDFLELGKQSKLNKLQNLYDSLSKENLLYIPSKNSIVTLFDKLNSIRNVDGSDSINSDIEKLSQKLPSISTLLNILNDFHALMIVNNINLDNAPKLQLTQENILSNETSKIVMDNFIHLIYRGKPNKCSTCGKRYGNTPHEKMLQCYHLDWHFRINRRLKGTSYNADDNNSTTFVATQRNIQSRNWYIPDLQWVGFKDDEIVSTRFNNDSKSTTDIGEENRKRNFGEDTVGGKRKKRSEENMSSPQKIGGNINSAEDTMDLSADLHEHYVIVPETMVDNSYKCSICQEEVTSIYDDDIGEWIWKNTIQVDGKYYHATCYKETKNI
ncbi:Pcf11p PWA37_000144 [Arxiozyma heterogenica]|uniref:Pcf11p n=1 Tax=Arxiozyma heterogenica TaxID=278026 RepID=UPI002EED22BC